MYASPSCQLIFQVEPELMIGKPFLLFIRSDDLVSFVEQVDLAKSSNVVSHMRFWFQSPNCMDEIPCEAMLFGAADGMIAILRRCKPFVRKKLILGDGNMGRTGGVTRVYPARSSRRNVTSANKQRINRVSAADKPSVNWSSSPSVSPLSSTHSSFISTTLEAAIPTDLYMSQGSLTSYESTSVDSSSSLTSHFSSPPAEPYMASLSNLPYQARSRFVSTLSTPPRSCSSSVQSATSSSGSYITGEDTVSAANTFGTRSYRAPLRSMPVGSINSIMNLDREHNRLRPLRSVHREEADEVDGTIPLPSGYQLRTHQVQEADLDNSTFFQERSQQHQQATGPLKHSLGSHPYRQTSPHSRDRQPHHASVHSQQQSSHHPERTPLDGQQQWLPRPLQEQQDRHNVPRVEPDLVLDHEQLTTEMMELELDDQGQGFDIAP